MTMRLLILLVALFTCSACKQEPEAVPDYGLRLPTVPFSYNSQSGDDLPTLGRVLFYDVRLSETNDISCGSCHKQAFGFADNKAFSKGQLDRSTHRNTMAIQNNSKGLFWDSRESDLRKMVLLPIYNESEMGVTRPYAMTEELNQLPYYRDLVKKVYRTTDRLTEKNISEALTAFVRTIQPNRSKFDRLVIGNTPGIKPAPANEAMTLQELDGMQLFNTKYNCNSCHNLQTGPSSNPVPVYGAGPGLELFANIGLESVPQDKGRQEVTGNPVDGGKFRVPSLRNIAVTAPYMHDGRFATLSEVIDHYADGVKSTPNLDDHLLATPGQPKKFVITDSEKEALIAFLRTLTDKDVLTNAKWADPFGK